MFAFAAIIARSILSLVVAFVAVAIGMIAPVSDGDIALILRSVSIGKSIIASRRPASGAQGASQVRLLDLFAGELGWSKIFAARGHQCICVDLKHPKILPPGCEFIQANVEELAVRGRTFVRDMHFEYIKLCEPDFIVASSPCEQFSIHCMRFRADKNPPYPELGIKLFNHTRSLCEASGLPYVMENVRCAEQFVGRAHAHAGSFYLWGSAVPPLVPKGLIKMGNVGGYYKKNAPGGFVHDPPGSRKPAHITATIPPELANCVCAYAERLLEQSPARRENQGAERE